MCNKNACAQDAAKAVDEPAEQWIDTVDSWRSRVVDASQTQLSVRAAMKYCLKISQGSSGVPGRYRVTCQSESDARARIDRYRESIEKRTNRGLIATMVEAIRADPLTAGKGRTNLETLTHSWIIRCSTCYGSGQLICGACRGRGQCTCFRCNGMARKTCERCFGTTRAHVYNPQIGGNVNQMCPRCHGMGVITCQSCLGSGRKRCQECNGGGKVQCEQCRGTGHFTQYLTATAFLDGEASYKWRQKEAPSWFGGFIREALNGEVPDVDIDEVVEWNHYGFELTDDRYPLEGQLWGVLPLTMAYIRPDGRFGDDVHTCKMVGRRYIPYELSGILNSTVEALLYGPGEDAVTEAKSIRPWISCRAAKEVHAQREGRGPAASVLERTRGITQDIKRAFRERLNEVESHYKRDRQRLSVPRILRLTGALLLLGLGGCIVVDTVVPGNLPWDRAGLGAAVRVVPPLYTDLASQSLGDVLSSLMAAAFFGALATLLWLLALGGVRRRTTFNILAHWLVLSIVAQCVWWGNWVVFSSFFEHGDSSATVVTSITGEIAAAILGSLWMAPDLFVIAFLVAILRARRTTDKEVRRIVKSLASPELEQRLNY